MPDQADNNSVLIIINTAWTLINIMGSIFYLVVFWYGPSINFLEVKRVQSGNGLVLLSFKLLNKFYKPLPVPQSADFVFKDRNGKLIREFKKQTIAVFPASLDILPANGSEVEFNYVINDTMFEGGLDSVKGGTLTIIIVTRRRLYFFPVKRKKTITLNFK